MQKEYRWTIEKDGNNHTILCQIEGNKYVLWADDEHIKTVYRKLFQRTRGGIDEIIELFRVACHFVVWENEIPVFYYNGQSLTDQSFYVDAKKRHDQSVKKLLTATFAGAALACVSYIGLSLYGVNMTQWIGAFVIALIYAIVNLVSITLYGK